jgi:mono/diheme cytochrome c family protein
MKRALIITSLSIISIAVSALIYIKIALPNVGAPPQISVDMSQETIARGAYLANSVALCMDCHAARDWTLFSGPPKSGTVGQGGERFDQTMGFPGIYYSRNLTPYGLADWTDGEIFHAITTGVSKNGNALFPIMPHPNYGRTSKEDIMAIISYLRSLESKVYDPPEAVSDFPMNFIINTIPRPAQFMGKPDGSDQMLKGKYLTIMASCEDCHTPFEDGKYDMENFLAGGRSFPMPGGTITTPNLTPHPATGLGAWTEDMFVQRFKAYQDSAYVIPKIASGEYNTMMPWLMYSTMEEEDLKAIFAYLQSQPPLEREIVRWIPDE